MNKDVQTAEVEEQIKTSATYGRILTASSITGGAQVATYLFGMARIKIAAIFLGPAGVGLIGLYVSITGMLESLSNLGIATSAVREIAAARGTGDFARASLIASVLRRISWVTGLLGWAITLLCAWPLSVWAFGSGEHAIIFTVLGGSLLLGALTGARTALLQGWQHLRELALVSVLSAGIGTVVSTSLYAAFGERGIVPALLAAGAINLMCVSRFSRSLEPVAPLPDWRFTWIESRRLIGLGVALISSTILMAAVALVSRGLIIRQLGLEANGVYQAAWGLSGMFAGFILSAMGMDFYPRLSCIAHDNVAVNRTVNEQTEVGVLLALPGLVGTFAFAPWVIQVFYTSEFLAGSSLLPLLVLGCFGQILGWPLGYIARAKGAVRWVLISEAALICIHLVLVVILLRLYGLWGVALAFALFYLCYTFTMLWVAHRLSGFRWSAPALRLTFVATVFVLISFASNHLFPNVVARSIGGGLTLGACLFSTRGIALRLGPGHRLVKAVSWLPGWALFCRAWR